MLSAHTSRPLLVAGALLLCAAAFTPLRPAHGARLSRNDPDGDGLRNRAERLIGTDPRNPDTDGDGVSDGDEVQTVGSDPRSADSDGDGRPDGVELSEGTDPTEPDDAGAAADASGPDAAPGDDGPTAADGTATSVDQDVDGHAHDGDAN